MPCRLLLLMLLYAEPLLDLAGARGADGLPEGWRTRQVRGAAPTSFEIRDGIDGPRLALSGCGSGSWAWRTHRATTGRLAWQWRVLRGVPGADLRRRGRDDAPVRVFVAFGERAGRMRGARLLCYSWGAGETVGTELASHVADRVRVIVAGNDAAADGGWRDATVQPFVDYARAWPTESPLPVAAVGVMQDTDGTGACSEAELRELEWRAEDTVD
jgi:hypothetical protein